MPTIYLCYFVIRLKWKLCSRCDAMADVEPIAEGLSAIQNRLPLADSTVLGGGLCFCYCWYSMKISMFWRHTEHVLERVCCRLSLFFFCRFEGAHMRSPQAAPMCQKRFGPGYFVVVSRQFFRATLAASRPVCVQRRFGSAGRCHCQRTLALLTTACFPIAAAAIEPATRSLSKNIWF